MDSELCNSDITSDEHDTKEQAQAVCDILKREGYGGDRKMFPVETWIEEKNESMLVWKYGPTATDKDPGKMWCYDCGKEVLWLYSEKPVGSYVCIGCGKTSDE